MTNYERELSKKEQWEFTLYGAGRIIFTEPTGWDEYTKNIRYETKDNKGIQYSISGTFIRDFGNVNPLLATPHLIYIALARRNIFSVSPKKPLIEPIWGNDPESLAMRDKWRNNPPEKKLRYSFELSYPVNGERRLVELHFRDCAWREAGCLEIVLSEYCTRKSDKDTFERNEYGEYIVPIASYCETEEMWYYRSHYKFITELSYFCHPELVYDEMVTHDMAEVIIGKVPAQQELYLLKRNSR